MFLIYFNFYMICIAQRIRLIFQLQMGIDEIGYSNSLMRFQMVQIEILLQLIKQ